MNEEIEHKLDKEELRLASFGKRALALLLDDLIVSVLILIAMFDKFSADNIEQTIGVINQSIMFVMMVKFAYHAVFVALYGATPGKMAMRIRVIDISTLDNPNWLASIARSSVRLVSEIMFYIGFAWAFANPLRQTWQDKAARTLVLDAS